MIKSPNKKLTNTQVIAIGFLLVILIGSGLLCLPISSKSGNWTSFLTSLFTATSATCVTGLIVVNTGTYWSFFGKTVILVLIQIGGIGFMTILTMMFLFMRKNLSLQERKLIMMSSDTQMSGIKGVIRRIIFGTIIFELIGAAFLFFSFHKRMKIKTAICYAIFHSVSAFCNAGFDLMASFNQSSFTGYTNDILLNITIIALITIGGIGFIVWRNIISHGIHISRYDLHTKIVLATSFILVVFGGVLFYFLEKNHSLASLTTFRQWMAAFFQSVTCRTAGFNSLDESKLSNAGAILSMFLMFIGGSPGSTAGGIKTSTFAVLFTSMLFCARNEESVTLFKKRIHTAAIKQASAIATFYLMLILISTTIISIFENYSITQILFEVVSAIGTVGLSMNITGSLCNASKIVLIFLMYAGRIGGLSLILAIAEKRIKVPLDRPTENIMIG